MSAESVSAAAVPLTPKKLEEIAEYEKIVKFRDDILAGRHPRIKVKLPSASLSVIAINFRANYYKDLDVDPRTKEAGIERALKAKMVLYSPYSIDGKRKRKSKSESVRRRVERDYLRAIEAHQVPSDPPSANNTMLVGVLPPRAGHNNSAMSWREQVEAANRES
ncbi:uncharacterized protein PAC_05450 [Phialocephala subalpina]|uniref:Uncharacterized protein n=1 Tax=Phialocephala subalpina TaxID=576137 RepID=A0A1L7WS25_9HELO|nr:uncharacterized protein PAC_05450 [Phialocephala subalpina]